MSVPSSELGSPPPPHSPAGEGVVPDSGRLEKKPITMSTLCCYIYCSVQRNCSVGFRHAEDVFFILYTSKAGTFCVVKKGEQSLFGVRSQLKRGFTAAGCIFPIAEFLDP